MPTVGLKLAAMAGLLFAMPCAAAPLEAYGQLPAIEQAAISPDGKLLAVAATNGEKRTVIIESLADRKAISGIRVGETKLRDLRWAGSNHVLITIEVHAAMVGPIIFGGTDHLGIIDYNVETRKQTVLPVGMDHALNTFYGPPLARVIDGKPYAFLHGQYFDSEGGEGNEAIFRVDLDRGATTVAETGLPHLEGWLVDGQGHPLAQTTYDAPSQKWSLRVWNGGAWRTVKTLTAPIETPELAGLGRDGRSILVDDRVDNAWVLRELAPDDTDYGPPLHDGEVETLHDNTTGRLIGLAGLEGDDLRYTFFDPGDQLKWRAVLAAFPGQPVALVGASTDHRNLLVRVDSATDGPAYAVVDLDAATAHWVGGEYSGLTPADIGAKRSIAFKAADGFALSGYLTLPPGKTGKDLPLVVLPHGGPEARDEPGFDWWAQGLASHGYAVLQVNYRGSGGFGWSYLSAGFGQWGRKMQTDLSDGVRYLAAQGIVDPKRVCIVGGSYGGYAALAGATLDTGVYRCAVSVAGVADLRKLVSRDKSDSGRQGVLVERYWLRYMGVERVDDPALQAISPAAQAAKDTIPILLIHGEQDYTVPFDQSRTMADALRAAGKPVTLIPLKSEDHYLSRGETRLQMLQATVDFLEKNNPPG
ncbi:MAG: alpha/beta hydrolase family protein [Caulobacterales bacterium]